MQMLSPDTIRRFGFTTPYAITLDTTNGLSMKQWQDLYASHPTLHRGTAASSQDVITNQVQDAAVLGASQKVLDQMSLDAKNFQTASPEQRGAIQERMQQQWQLLAKNAVGQNMKGQVVNVKA